MDDGTYEDGSQCSGLDCFFVQRLTPLSYPSLLTKACICWKSIEAPGMSYDLVVFDDNGVGGEPGTRIDSMPTSISGVNLAGKYHGIACAPLGVSVTSGSVYVGANWDTFVFAPGGDFYMCTDESVSTPEARAYLSSNGVFWTDITSISSVNALGIRAEFTPTIPPPPDDCETTETTLCLANRFRVSVTWENFEHQTGVGHADNLTVDSGTFWFFSASNIEMLVKTVNACGLAGFDNFWFFAAATTNVEYDITVTDTGVTPHVSKTYHNDLGVAAPAITDTDAFQTCP